jgi:hypothetical protein
VPDSLLQQQKEPNPPAPLNLCSLFNWGVIREIRAKKKKSGIVAISPLP